MGLLFQATLRLAPLVWRLPPRDAIAAEISMLKRFHFYYGNLNINEKLMKDRKADESTS